MLMRLPKVLLFLLVTGVIWLLVLGWWRANDYQPGAGEALLFLIGMPIALFGGYWLLSRFFDYLQSPSVAPSAAARADIADSAAETPAQTQVAAPSFVVLGSAIACKAGLSSADLLAAAQAGTRPAIDNQLTDDDGFPVFVSRSDVADAAATEIEETLTGPLADQRLSSETLRALGLLSAAIDELTPILDDLLAQPEHDIGINVLWLQPEGWPTNNEPAWQTWLMSHFPSELQHDGIAFTRQAVATDADAIAAIDQTMAEATTSNITIVVAAVSYVGETTLRRWQAGKRLFSADHQTGQIPGETAIAMMLTSPESGLIDDPQTTSIVHTTVIGTTNGGSKKKDNALDALITQTVSAVLSGNEDVGALVADTDHRAEPLQEVLTSVNEHFGSLDPINDCTTISIASGAVEPFGGLLAMLCADEQAKSLKQPTLSISNQHPRSRTVTVVRPANWGVDAPQTNS